MANFHSDMTEEEFKKQMENLDFINTDVKGLFAHGDAISKPEAIRLCGQFLGGSWVDVDQNDFNITVHQ